MTSAASSSSGCGLMLTHDAPIFDNWDQDETAVADRYGEPRTRPPWRAS